MTTETYTTDPKPATPATQAPIIVVAGAKQFADNAALHHWGWKRHQQGYVLPDGRIARYASKPEHIKGLRDPVIYRAYGWDCADTFYEVIGLIDTGRARWGNNPDV